jgi:hypothetical protein
MYAPQVHDHPLTGGLRLTLVSIGVFMLLLAAGLGLVTTYAFQDHAYVEGRGELRDRENAELNRRIDDAMRQSKCDLLDRLPQGPLLDPIRAEYDCGPGIPLDQLPPSVAQNFGASRLPPQNTLPPVDVHAPIPEPSGVVP